MTEPHWLDDATLQNNPSLEALLRAITKSRGEFSLILVLCNYTVLRESIVKQLREQCPIQIRELVLEESINTLYTTIKKELGQEWPTALMIFNLESVSAIDQVLVAANNVREEFRNLSCPLVLWVTDEVLQKLIRLVPDFESWASTVEFAISAEELLDERQ
jgi:hypothetical protein